MPKVTAIVPAYNEEKNVGEVLKVLLNSKDLDEIILVNDGSVDNTGEIGKNLGVKVINLKNGGKGNAMRKGVEATDAEIIVFFDADLIGLNSAHVRALVGPMLTENVAMCVGVRDRAMGLAKFIAKTSFIMAIGGERAVRREVFEKIPDKFLKGFRVETALNSYCLSKKLPIKYVILNGLDIVIKEKKWGLLKGFKSRIKMIWEMLQVRVALIFFKIK